MRKPEPTKYPPEKLPKYPHMRPEDVRIWELFLDTNALPNAQVAYDVHLGSTPTPPPGAPEFLKKHIAAVYPKKADAVIYFPNQTLVVEIKPFAGLTAIGQALGYKELFFHDFPFVTNPTACIITDKAQPDIPSLCRKLGIVLLEVSPGHSD